MSNSTSTEITLPYSYPNNIPKYIKGLPVGAQKLFVKVFNKVYAKHNDEDKARKAGWGAVKNEYNKVKGKWVKSVENLGQFAMQEAFDRAQKEKQMNNTDNVVKIDLTYLAPVGEVSETSPDNPEEKPTYIAEVEILPEGKWDHPNAPNGKLVIDRKLQDEIIDNFNSSIVGPEVPVDVDHVAFGTGSTVDKPSLETKAWIKSLYTRMKERKVGGVPTIVRSIYGMLQFNSRWFGEEVKNGYIKYFSPQLILNYKDPETGKRFNVLKTGAFTNIPHIKNMDPVTCLNFSEVMTKENSDALDLDSYELVEAEDGNYFLATSEGKELDLAGKFKGYPAWSKVDKTKLPAAAYAYVPDKNKRSTWKLPYKYYRDGKLVEHPGGVLAAYQAIKGARSGKKIMVSREAVKKIMAACKRFGFGPYSKKSKKMSASEFKGVEVIDLADGTLDFYIGDNLPLGNTQEESMSNNTENENVNTAGNQAGANGATGAAQGSAPQGESGGSPGAAGDNSDENTQPGASGDNQNNTGEASGDNSNANAGNSGESTVGSDNASGDNSGDNSEGNSGENSGDNSGENSQGNAGEASAGTVQTTEQGASGEGAVSLAEHEALKTRLHRIEVERQTERIEVELNELVTAGKLTPALKECARPILLEGGSAVISLSENGKKVESNMAAAFRKFLSAMPVIVDFNQKATQQQEGPAGNVAELSDAEVDKMKKDGTWDAKLKELNDACSE